MVANLLLGHKAGGGPAAGVAASEKLARQAAVEAVRPLLTAAVRRLGWLLQRVFDIAAEQQAQCHGERAVAVGDRRCRQTLVSVTKCKHLAMGSQLLTLSSCFAEYCKMLDAHAAFHLSVRGAFQTQLKGLEETAHSAMQRQLVRRGTSAAVQRVWGDLLQAFHSNGSFFLGFLPAPLGPGDQVSF